VAYVGKYLILFPVVAFSWFAILTTLLAFLARGQTIDEVLLISMAYFSLSASLDGLLGALLSWKTIVYYLGFMIGLEFVMRITTPALKPLFTQRQSV